MTKRQIMNIFPIVILAGAFIFGKLAPTSACGRAISMFEIVSFDEIGPGFRLAVNILIVALIVMGIAALKEFRHRRLTLYLSLFVVWSMYGYLINQPDNDGGWGRGSTYSTAIIRCPDLIPSEPDLVGGVMFSVSITTLLIFFSSLLIIGISRRSPTVDQDTSSNIEGGDS